MRKLLFSTFFLLLAYFSQAQLLEENFERYTSTARLNLQWKFDNTIELDTNFYSSGKQALKVSKASQLIYKIPNERLGKFEFSIFTHGPGVWNVIVSVGTSLNFYDETAWTKVDNFPTELGTSSFSTKTADINRLEQHFIRLSFEPVGTATPLYLDDVVLHEISREAENIIREEKKQKQLEVERQKHVERLIESASYSDAKRLVKSYQKTYTKRVKSLSMLYDKSNMIKIVSGTAATLGDFNQLSNPTRYKKYEQLQSTLFPKLEAIDTLFYSDQVKGRLSNFFKKIENPLNLAMGIGDMFTGGAVSKVVDSFKGLITKGFSAERLETLGFKRGKLIGEQNKGIRLYLEAKDFFEDIETQNERTLVLNKKIFEVYKNSKSLNDDIVKLYIEYLALARISADKNLVIEVSKNQDYKSFGSGIDDYFKSLLGSERDFNKDVLTNRIKEIDGLIQRIDLMIAEYNKLSNQLSSFYSDFKKEVSRDCPFRNVTPADKEIWSRNTARIKSTLSEVEKSFNESYISVNFKQ